MTSKTFWNVVSQEGNLLEPRVQIGPSVSSWTVHMLHKANGILSDGLCKMTIDSPQIAKGKKIGEALHSDMDRAQRNLQNSASSGE